MLGLDFYYEIGSQLPLPMILLTRGHVQFGVLSLNDESPKLCLTLILEMLGKDPKHEIEC